jgi:hypothetical protein
VEKIKSPVSITNKERKKEPEIAAYKIQSCPGLYFELDCPNDISGQIRQTNYHIAVLSVSRKVLFCEVANRLLMFRWRTAVMNSPNQPKGKI